MCCWRTDTKKCSGICSLKLSSVGHCTAAAESRFHCTIVFGKKEYLYESKLVWICRYGWLCVYCRVLLSDGTSRLVGIQVTSAPGHFGT